jgi:hypothetical protein
MLALTAFAKISLGLWMMSRALIGGQLAAWLCPLLFLLGLAVIFAFDISL